MIEQSPIKKSVVKMRGLPTNVISIASRNKRLDSIDLLRGAIMTIMALDHTRDYFHNDAFLFSPTDLDETSVILFFTRWVTHFCAPVFVFLAGISAYLYGIKRSRKELSFYLFTRGLWLVFIELFIISLERTFNPAYSFFNLQVLFAIGVSMMVLSAAVYMNNRLLLVMSILLVAGHNLLDGIGRDSDPSFWWSLLHKPGLFTFGRFTWSVHYPVLPWLGIMGIGYCLGSLYAPGYDPAKRKKIFKSLGLGAIVLFVILRSGNWYGDAAHWTSQKNDVFSILSFLNISKYPPSLLYILIMLGPALLFLPQAEKPLKGWIKKITIFGRVPMFFYLAHILLIHLLALPGAAISGYHLSDMILTTSVNRSAQLNGYGFDLPIVYVIWIAVILILYPLCNWFDRYKQTHLAAKKWLSYL